MLLFSPLRPLDTWWKRNCFYLLSPIHVYLLKFREHQWEVHKHKFLFSFFKNNNMRSKLCGFTCWFLHEMLFFMMRVSLCTDIYSEHCIPSSAVLGTHAFCFIFSVFFTLWNLSPSEAQSGQWIRWYYLQILGTFFLSDLVTRSSSTLAVSQERAKLWMNSLYPQNTFYTKSHFHLLLWWPRWALLNVGKRSEVDNSSYLVYQEDGPFFGN